ncbi:MAG: DUF4294 domain-containing protein [Paludibacter sp.]|nr:DUF4294 domain-containing protein [Paludibacter sp.]MDD4197962.1 DUF4294 domain-containing protein [Paludibacter sp.]MDD4427223.1 DUF4294 domain-containing protein [Paludibacter sp.]
MNRKLNILILMVFMSGLIIQLSAQPTQEALLPGSQRLAVQILGNDTVYLAFLRDIYVFPKMKFKSKRQEEFYWRTVRDVKKALPYAKIVSSELIRVNTLLGDINKENERKRYLARYEKEIFKRYEPELRKLTLNQGRLLLKLIDRECNSTSYDLIKNYRGSVSAFFWQGVARIFGSNLKSEYDSKGNDKIVERVILLVEAGQL